MVKTPGVIETGTFNSIPALHLTRPARSLPTPRHDPPDVAPDHHLPFCVTPAHPGVRIRQAIARALRLTRARSASRWPRVARTEIVPPRGAERRERARAGASPGDLWWRTGRGRLGAGCPGRVP